MRTQTKDDRLAARYIPKNSRRVLVKADGLSCIYVYEFQGKSGGDRFGAIAYRGTAARSSFHYTFRSAEQRAAYINEFIRSIQTTIASRQEKRQQRAAWTNPLTVGTILYTSWGYDQTNVEFFVVTKVSGRRTWVREIASDFEATGDMSGKTWPAMPIRFTSEETMHTAQPADDKGVYVKISDCRHAWPETGREHHTSSYA